MSVCVYRCVCMHVCMYACMQEPGNFGDPMNFNQYTKEMREREINNGRFAMFAAIGIIAAEMYTGKDAVEQWG